MKNETAKLMEDVIVARLNELKSLDADSENRGDIQKEIIELSKLLIENDKVELDFAERRDKREAEAKDMKWDRYARYGLEIMGIGLPLVFYGVWMNKGFRFEETGTFTSQTFRGLFGRFSPKK